MNKLICVIGVIFSSFLNYSFAHELPDCLEKQQFFTIEQEWHYFDAGWGDHEWLYQLKGAFDDEITLTKLYVTFHRSAGWNSGDHLYFDSETNALYNLRTQKWVTPSETQFVY